MLTNGRPYLAIPGPSVMPDPVLAAMQRPAPNIYAGELVDMMPGIARDLRIVAGTSHDLAIYIGNGHALWEAALSNLLARGDRALVLATGHFGHGWADMARGLGLEIEVMTFESAANPQQVEDRLRQPDAAGIKAVLLCQTDTATGILSDVPAIRAAIDAAGHDALYLVDCIASMGCDRFEMDAWGADCAIAASQKGLMTPPGLGFVWFGPKAAAARARQEGVSRYWDWTPRSQPTALWQYFGGTPPTHHLYALRAALDLIMAEGLEGVWHRHTALSQAVWAAFGRWSEGGPLALTVADPAIRSHAVTACTLPGGGAQALQDWCRTRAGLTLGLGLGRSPEGDFFRIGHMGHVNAQMILGVLGTIEAGLQALKIPHGTGAIESAAGVIAGAAPA